MTSLSTLRHLARAADRLARLRAAYELSGLTRDDLAERAGVSIHTVVSAMAGRGSDSAMATLEDTLARPHKTAA